MPIIVESDGVEIEFPDDFTEDQISEALTGFQPRNSEVQSSQEDGNQPTVSQPYIPDSFQPFPGGGRPMELSEAYVPEPPSPEEQAEMAKLEGSVTEAITRGISVSPQTFQNAWEAMNVARKQQAAQMMGQPFDYEGTLLREAGGREVEPGTGVQIAAGLQNVGAGIAGSFADPINAAAMATGMAIPKLAPAISGAFALHMAGAIPEQARAAGEASVGGTPFEKTTAFGNLATTAAFVPGLGRHAIQGARPAVARGIQALQELTPEGKLMRAERLEAAESLEQHNQLNQAIENLSGDPDITRDITKQARLERLQETQKEIGLSKPHQKILEDQMLGVDVPVEVVWGSPKRRQNQFMGIDRATGKIEVYGETFPQWVESVARKKRTGAVRSALREEQTHLQTPPEAAKQYWDSLSKLERTVVEKIYGAKPGENGFTETDLGYEALRQRLDRAAGETPREFAEASMEEGLDMKALELLGNAVRGIRERLLRTGASKEGLAQLEKVSKNVDAARERYKAENPDPDWSIEGGEAEAGPAAIIRNPKEWEGHVRSYRDVPIDQFGAKLKQSPSGLLTPEAWRIGLAASKPEHIRELQQARQESSRLGKEAREKGDLDTAMIHYTRGQFFREAYEAATGTGSAGEALREIPGYKPPFPESEGGPAAIKKPKPEDLLKRKPGEAKPEEVMALDDAEAIKFFKGNQDRGNSTQNDAVLAGMKLGPGVIEELTQLRDATHKSGLEKLQAGMESGDAQAGMADFGKVIWLNGVIEGAGRKGPNYEGVKARMEQEGPAAFVKRPEKGRENAKPEDWIPYFQNKVDVLKRQHAEAGLKGDHVQEKILEKKLKDAEVDLADAQQSTDVDEASFPAAMSKKAQAAARDRAKLMALRQAAEEGREMPKMEAPVSQPEYQAVAPGERVGAEEAGALPRISGVELERAATKLLGGEIKTRPIKRERAETGPPRVSYDRPSFDKFSAWAERNMEGAKPNQIQQLWEDKVWSELLRASPERLEEWRKALGLESSYGRGPIAEPPPEETTFRLEQEFHEGKRYAAKVLKEERSIAGSRNRYRNKLVEAIGLKLVGESFKERPELSRETITIDDVDFGNTKTQAGPYRELSRDEISDPQVLNRILRDQARASSADPESASRRLVAVVDNQGRVELLSTYNDAGVQRVTDPTGPRTKGRPHRELNQAFLRQYRPIATVLLENPVQAFHQRFGSVSEFMDRIGKEAIDRSRVGEFPGEGAAEDFEAEGTAGLEGEGGLVMGPTAKGVRAEMGIGRGALESTSPLTDREAGSILEHVLDEVGDFTGAADVRESLAGLTDRAARKRLKPTDWIALSGFNKAFKALEERNPDLGREDILDRMADQIYESYATSDPNKPETFVTKALAAFTPEGGQAVRPVPERQAAPTQGGPRLTPGPMPRPIPGAGGPPLRGITAQAAQIRQARRGRAETPSRKPEMMTREEAAYVRKRPWSPANPEIRTEGRFEGEGPAAIRKDKRDRDWEPDVHANKGGYGKIATILPDYLSRREWEPIREAVDSFIERVHGRKPSNDGEAMVNLMNMAIVEEPYWGWRPTSADAMQGEVIKPTPAEAATINNFFRKMAGTPYGREELIDFEIKNSQERPEQVDYLEKLKSKLFPQPPDLIPPSHTQKNFLFPGGLDAEGPAAFFKRKKLGPTVTDAIRNTGSVYDEWMVDRIGRVGGDMSKQFSDQAKAITDRSKELYGSLTPTLDPARKAAGAMGRATTWLHGKINVTPFAATRRIVDVMEGNLPIPPWAQKTVDLARAANLEIGRMLQAVAPGFVATGKFARNITAYAYDIIRQGRGIAWQAWTAGIARANKLPISDVRTFFREWKDILDKPGADVATIERINQDFARKYPNVITDIKVGGVWQPVVHGDLFNYLENSAQRAAHIRAFREVFPNTTKGRASLMQAMEDVRREIGPEHQKDLDALVRTLQGHPTDSYANWGIMSPVRLPGQAFRIFNQTVGNLLARGVLTGQMFVQPGENITGATPVFLGYKNYLRGMAQVMRGGLYAQLEQQGAVNRVMYDWSFDPQAKVRSTFRIAGNVLSKASGQQLLNEWQEASAAATAHVVTERIKAGTLSDWENRMLPQTFKTMGFDQTEISAMMLGDPAMLAQFERKAAAFLTSGNKAVAESSRIGANRLFNSIFRFQTYPMMKTQQLRRVMGEATEAWDKGTPEQKRAATEQLSRFLFGATLQGAITVGITTLFYQGRQGVQIRGEEAQDDPLVFLGESFIATIGGPMYIVWRGARNKGVIGVGEQATRVVFPYQVVREMSDMASGAGRYKDRSTFERIGAFIEARLPGSKAIRTGLAWSGLSMEDRALDASIAAFYRWRRDELGFSENEDFLKDDTRSEFRGSMKRAVEALKRGDTEAFNDAYLAAAGVAGEKAQEKVAASFRGRKLLKTPDGQKLTPEQLEALHKHIGFEAVDRLQYFDLMLEEAADGVVLPRKE